MNTICLTGMWLIYSQMNIARSFDKNIDFTTYVFLALLAAGKLFEIKLASYVYLQGFILYHIYACMRNNFQVAAFCFAKYRFIL